MKDVPAIPYDQWLSFQSLKVLITKDKWWITEGETKPTITCPKCGGALLGENMPHGVHSDGTIHASVVCGHPKCSFHAHVKLDEWNGGVIPHK